MARKQWLVPRELLKPVGAAGTQRLKRCADTWTDSDVEALRAELPHEYHAVPIWWLRRAWMSIRKAKTPGYRVNGHGPGKGWKEAPAWYIEYLESGDWKQRREQWLKAWGYRCALNKHHSEGLEVHHRTYDNLGAEEPEDCVVLCSRCHELHHKNMPIAPKQRPQTSQPLFAGKVADDLTRSASSD